MRIIKKQVGGEIIIVCQAENNIAAAARVAQAKSELAAGNIHFTETLNDSNVIQNDLLVDVPLERLMIFFNQAEYSTAPGTSKVTSSDTINLPVALTGTVKVIGL